MIRILKYPLRLIPEQTIIVPYASELLHVDAEQELSVALSPLDGSILLPHIQYGDPSFFVWARTWGSEPGKNHMLRIYSCGTGDDITHSASGHPHLGTILVNGGALVWHFFAKREPEPVV